MPTRQQVLMLIRSGRDYQEAGRTLGIPAGQAYMLATGVPADGSDGLSPEELHREGMLTTSQHLVYPGAENPTRKEHVLDWVRSRARRDTQQQESAARRSSELPPPLEPDDHDVLTVLRRDHNRVDRLTKQLQTIPGSTKGGTAEQISRRASIVDMVAKELSGHEVAEQEVFWPAVRRALADGDDRADAALEQESEGTRTLAELGDVPPDSEGFDELVGRLIHQAHAHVAFEDKVFLDIGGVLSDEDRQELGDRLLRKKSQAPTRPHPHAPTHSPAVNLAAPGAGAVDRVRDATGRPADRKGQPDREDGDD